MFAFARFFGVGKHAKCGDAIRLHMLWCGEKEICVDAFRPGGREASAMHAVDGGGHDVSGRSMYWFAKIASGLAHRALSA